MLGYRERRALKAQQQQQALGNSLQSEQRVRIMAPRGMNLRDDARSLSRDQATYIDNALPDQDGLRIERAPTVRAWMASTSSNSQVELIAYEGTTSATDALFCFQGTRILNVGEVLATSATATCSAVSAPGMLSNVGGRHIQTDQTLIFCNSRGQPLQYTGGNWGTWTATVSAAPGSRPMSQQDGIYQFKSRIYTWYTEEPGFAYSSVDAVKGTFEFFNLAYVMGDEGLRTMTAMSRDGGAGPDDYAVFIGKRGTVVVYEGSNPGDATDWSLVGKYKIGKPFADDCAVEYGSQIFVLCEDDVYVLPDDLQGKRSHSNASYPRAFGRGGFDNPKMVNGLYWAKKNCLIWSDTTTLSVRDNFSFTQSKVRIPTSTASGHNWENTSASTISNVRSWPAFDKEGRKAKIALYKDRLYTAVHTNSSGPDPILEVMPDIQFGESNPPSYHSIIHTGPIPMKSRTNISMVNPVFVTRAPFTSSNFASANANVVYRTAVVYDQEHKQIHEATATAELWLTTTASTDSKGMWQPAFGTGDVAQVQIEVISASTSAELILKYIDITMSDTGGI